MSALMVFTQQKGPGRDNQGLILVTYEGGLLKTSGFISGPLVLEDLNHFLHFSSYSTIVLHVTATTWFYVTAYLPTNKTPWRPSGQLKGDRRHHPHVTMTAAKKLKETMEFFGRMQ